MKNDTSFSEMSKSTLLGLLKTAIKSAEILKTKALNNLYADRQKEAALLCAAHNAKACSLLYFFLSFKQPDEFIKPHKSKLKKPDLFWDIKTCDTNNGFLCEELLCYGNKKNNNHYFTAQHHERNKRQLEKIKDLAYCSDMAIYICTRDANLIAQYTKEKDV